MGMTKEVPDQTTWHIARRYGVSERTVRRWIDKGHLVPTTTTEGGQARFTVSDLDNQLKGYK